MLLGRFTSSSPGASSLVVHAASLLSTDLPEVGVERTMQAPAPSTTAPHALPHPTAPGIRQKLRDNASRFVDEAAVAAAIKSNGGAALMRETVMRANPLAVVSDLDDGGLEISHIGASLKQLSPRRAGIHATMDMHTKTPDHTILSAVRSCCNLLLGRERRDNTIIAYSPSDLTITIGGEALRNQRTLSALVSSYNIAHSLEVTPGKTR